MNNSDHYVALYEDAIKFCNIFSWTDSTIMIIAPHLHCLLLNLIPKEIIHPFKAAGITMWKETKKRFNLTKSPLGNYRHSKYRSATQPQSHRLHIERGYRHPFNDS
ncbi:3585_t:CDS:2 [Rhizophagus irregularis]|nr:3585_t:CDS:2 [Rhizophagus irregularis]